MDEAISPKAFQNDYADIALFTGFTREAQTMMQLCDVIVLGDGERNVRPRPHRSDEVRSVCCGQ
jgi:hypothetical protein